MAIKAAAIHITFGKKNPKKQQKKQKTRLFSNHESHLLSRSHIFASIVIVNRFENTSKYVDTLTLFSKNLNQRSLTRRWPLTPCLLRSHVWLYPRIIVPSPMTIHQCMWISVIILQNTTYILHTTCTYYVHTTYRMSDHIVSYWTQFRRDKKWKVCFMSPGSFKIQCRMCFF